MPSSKRVMDWDRLRIFHMVAQVGNITLAGERLGLSQSSVSRHVRLLEQDLNAPLFHRLSHGVVLTEQGELLYESIFAATSFFRPSAGSIMAYILGLACILA